MKPGLKKGILGLLTVLVVLYVLMNVALIGFAPILHGVSLELTVLDETVGHPLPGVELSWVNTNLTTGFEWTKPFGATDESGHFSYTKTVQQQPLWVFPTIGSFDWRNEILRLKKEGYDLQTVSLSELAAPVPLANAAATVTVRMKKSKHENR
jgi:hypothetical protein